ncbi:cyclic nucleotide-binding domain-containing protein [Mucilaginibacter roseus]|uniref:Cyclic nucleotide-binding domain-containing protein n=1 Tax=Mucilaginibacter roseus TaxID=1528868 RepID=A0ABS8TZ47_9SPHI|nr:cyclic nucleotide-binding domain-containing protein [Mucilaginibacter roseus]MCD8739070.1 cyclic nucleotide-binding domain-containing protein [Mucilaginibacter roseus]
MSVEDIIAELAKITALSPGLTDRLRTLLISEVYHPRQVIASPGHNQHRLWLVESGIIRSYYPDERGREITQAFYTANDLIFFWEGYLAQRTDHYLEALHNVNLYSLRYTDLDTLRDFPETETLFRYFILQQRRTELFRNRLLLQSADQRYRQYRKAYPGIFREVPLRLIASFLHMTRENLSRLIGRDREG